MNSLTARLDQSQFKMLMAAALLSLLCGLALALAPTLSLLGIIFSAVALWSFLQPKWGIYFSLGLAFVMSPFPETEHSFPLMHVGFAGLGLCVIAGWLCRLAIGKAQLKRSDLFCPTGALLLLFFLMGLTNFLMALANDVGIYEWVRGIAPFLILIYSFIFLTEFKEPRDIKRVIGLVKLGLIGFALESVFIYLKTQDRVTYEEFRLILPYTLIGGIIYFSQLLNRIHDRRAILSLFLWLLFVAGTLFTFTRGLILGLALGCVFLLWKKVSPAFLLRRYMLVKLLMGLISLAFLIYLSSGWQNQDLSLLVQQRVDDSQTIEGRVLEVTATYREALESPLLGKGFGYKYATPFEFVFDTDRRRYIHNFLAYFLLTTGLIGSALYTGLYVTAYRLLGGKNGRSDADGIGLDPQAVQAILIGILFYSFTSANFRTFQYNVLLSFFLYLAFLRRDRTINAQGL